MGENESDEAPRVPAPPLVDPSPVNPHRTNVAVRASRVRSRLVFTLLDAICVVAGYSLAQVTYFRDKAPGLYWQYLIAFLAAALVCTASLFGQLSRQTSFVVLGAIYGGLLAGRLVSFGLNAGVAGYGPTILVLYAVDAIGLSLAVASFVLENQLKA